LTIGKYLHKNKDGTVQKRTQPVVSKSEVIREVLRQHGVYLATKEVCELCADQNCQVSASEVLRVRHVELTHPDDLNLEREVGIIRRAAKVFGQDLRYTQAAFMAISDGVTNVSRANLRRKGYLW
jgi:hypothetical protein